MSLKKSFSEFLVDQKLVSTEHLVDLLIHQSKAHPTVVELVRANELLTPSQILACLGLQMRSATPCDFLTAAKDLGYWSQALIDGLTSAQAAAKVPLAELLQKSGLVSTHALTLALDNYLSSAATAPPKQMAPSPIPVAATEVPLSESPSDFEEFYSVEVSTRLMSIAKEWSTSDDSATRELIDLIHGLVGAARFAKLESLESLFKEAESSVRGAADLPGPLDAGLMTALRLDLISILERVRVQFEAA